MKSFSELYNEFNNNSEILQASDEAVRESKKQKKLCLWLCLIIDIIIIGFMYFIIFRKHFYIGMIGVFIVPIFMIDIVIFIATYFAFSSKQRKYIPIFKEQIIKKLMNNFFDDLEYFPSKKMPMNIYNEPKYHGYYNRYHSDDYLEAKLDDKYLIDMAEVKTEDEETSTDSEGHTTTHTYTIFHGLFAKVIIDKSINSNLRITSNNDGLYSNKLNMDSTVFEKKFNVYASDKIIGMQILTADIMEEILEFRSRIDRDFDIFINENNIYLRFHCGPMFEPKLVKEGTLDEKSLKLYYNIINFICDLSKSLINIIDNVEI